MSGIHPNMLDILTRAWERELQSLLYPALSSYLLVLIRLTIQTTRIEGEAARAAMPRLVLTRTTVRETRFGMGRNDLGRTREAPDLPSIHARGWETPLALHGPHQGSGGEEPSRSSGG